MISRVNMIKKILFYLVVALICSIIIFPFVLLFFYSLKTNAEIFSLDIRLISRNPTFAAYKNIFLEYGFEGANFSNWAFNSLAVCSSAAVSSTFIASLCGYGISRFRFYGRGSLQLILILTQTIPGVVILLPYYVLLSKLGMLNKLSSLSFSYFVFSIPVSTWLFTGFFKSISVEIEEAALIDGCTHFGVFYRIVLPIALPSVIAIMFLAFVGGWGDYLFASIFISNAEKWTLPISLSSFESAHRILWSEIMAMSTLVTVPIVILFLYLQRYLVGGLMAGSVKR